MKSLIRRMPWAEENVAQLEPLLNREWLVTNGLGGYASGTLAGVITRRYHGLLTAAMPAPLGRLHILTHLSEQLRLPDGKTVRFSGEERTGSTAAVYSGGCLTEFRLEAGLPIWQYNVHGVVLEKSVLLPHQQNTVYVTYRLLEGPEHVRLKLMPTVSFRPHGAPVSTPLPKDFQLTIGGHRYELTVGSQLPAMRMAVYAERPAFTMEPQKLVQLLYRMEESRGYDSKGDLWSPGYFRVDLKRARHASFVASTEPWAMIEALEPAEVARLEQERRQRLLDSSHPETRTDVAAELVLAADQFIIRPAGRVQDAAFARAAGDEVYTVVAGYHWFTDWGRDTMISLEGLALLTGRHVEAGYILRTFAHYIRDGLIPNLFPEQQQEGLYHTADATLWFFHALSRYLSYTGDRLTLRLLLPKLHDVIDHHFRGTRFGIGVDPADGLLRQGTENLPLTWMDAKVDDWVVTPRRGKAVEINALWYNALRLMEDWVREEDSPQAAKPLAEHAAQAKTSFNERFWHAPGNLYDVVDGPHGDDAACRPNQIFSFVLEHPVLNRSHWSPVLETVQRELLTPVGLRSLARSHPDYKPRYDGDLRARDAAYHQGTVWAWLIGPYVDAWLRVHPNERRQACAFLDGFAGHLGEACLGTISEVFDAEPPYTPRGCIAQAWSVAEVLRSWVNTIAGASPGSAAAEEVASRHR